tara:strand:- start:563 stop:817 length:255 start_codon:yes stop_codon:yes gene_type:complete
LVSWLLEQNERVSKRSANQWFSVISRSSTLKKGGFSSNTVEKALDKAEQNGFYLGMSWDWLVHQVPNSFENIEILEEVELEEVA